MQPLLDAVYLTGLGLASPYILWKMATGERWRAGLRERLGFVEPRCSDRPCIWVHGVSVGEILAAKTFVRSLAAELPGYDLAVSSTTNTGYQVARRTFPDSHVIYYPLDFSPAVARAFARVRPAAVVLVELEIWPNFLAEAVRRRVPVVVVNGRITERSFRRYRLVRRLLARPLRAVSRFCVQSEVYAARFRAIGAEPRRVVVTGSMKYDNIPAVDPGPLGSEMRAELGLAPDEPVFVCGSTHAPEERLLADAWRRARAGMPGLRLVLVPRHVERTAEVRRGLEEAGEHVVLRSELASAPRDGRAAAVRGKAILVDTMGELQRIYAAASVVFVGGSLIPHGGQNVLEPAGLGKPVLFGPYTENFRESVDELIAHGAARRAADPAGLARAILELLGDPARAREMGDRARACIERERGATRRTVDVVRDVVSALAQRKGGA